VMIDADQPALQDRKDAFDAIGRHVREDVFASAVVDGIVVEPGMMDTGVCAAFIGEQAA
jgi:hypothetical protein